MNGDVGTVGITDFAAVNFSFQMSICNCNLRVNWAMSSMWNAPKLIRKWRREIVPELSRVLRLVFTKSRAVANYTQKGK